MPNRTKKKNFKLYKKLKMPKLTASEEKKHQLKMLTKYRQNSKCREGTIKLKIAAAAAIFWHQ